MLGFKDKSLTRDEWKKVHKFLEKFKEKDFVGWKYAKMVELKTQFYAACKNGRVDVLRSLLAKDDDALTILDSIYSIDFDDGSIMSNIHIAAIYGHYDCVKVMIQNGVDVNAVCNKMSLVDDGGTWKEDYTRWTALHIAACYCRTDVLYLLLENGADVNVIDKHSVTALGLAAASGLTRGTLQLLCFGAEINKDALKDDITELLQPINDSLESLRAGNGVKKNLMSDEERRYMWNLAFCFTIAHRGAAFKAHYAIRSFITFNGIFMGPGYDIGDESIWRRGEHEDTSDDLDW